MAKYYENLQVNRDAIEKRITRGIPEMAKLMVTEKLITEEEKFQIISYMSTGRAKQLLDIVENKYCIKKFIRMLYKCHLEDCADLIKGDAELSSDEEDEKENLSSSLPVEQPKLSSHEQVAETNSAQLRSDLQEAGERIKHLETENGRLQREKIALQCKINELQTSLNCLQRKDRMFKVQSKELDETKNELKLVEKKLTEIESKDYVKEHARLCEELTETKEQVKSLAEDMKKRDIKMDKILDNMGGKLDTLVHHLVSVPKIDTPERASVPISERKPVPITGRTSVPITGKTSVSTRERNSRPKTGKSSAQVVLPPIKTDTKK